LLHRPVDWFKIELRKIAESDRNSPMGNLRRSS
jgi:hypothetical protein